MEYAEINQARRSVHYFARGKGLQKELLDKIINQAVLAPSGYNLQPWQFLVLTAPEQKRHFRDLAYDQKHVTDSSATVIVLGKTHLEDAYIDGIFADWSAKGYMPEAAAQKTAESMKVNMQKWDEATKRLWATRSASLVAMNLMLAAKANGVESCPMEGFQFEGLLEEFAIPDGYYPTMAICLGYRDEEKPLLERKERLGANVKIWWNQVA